MHSLCYRIIVQSVYLFQVLGGKMRIYNGCFIAIFMAMIMLPLVFVDLKSDRVSVTENRKLTNHPPISDLKNHPGDFIRGFEAWFKDSTGFRERLIKLYKKTDGILGENSYYLDGTSIVFVGKQGHHFHTHYNQLLPIYQGKRWLDDVQSDKLSIKLNKINEYLRERNISFVVMLCADKESIYPEYYPDFVIRGPEPSSLDVVVKYLSTHTNIDFFCIKEAFLMEKENHLLFPKTGNIYELCHYNETGSFIAYQELMKHINTYFPNLKSFSIKDVDIKYLENGSTNVILKNERNYEWIEARFFDNAIEFENKDASLPVLLLFRDSYTDWFHNYLPQHFSRTIMHHYDTLEHFEEYVDLYKPDIVVFESAERALGGFANCVIGIPELPH
jgi:hypothetical protein